MIIALFIILDFINLTLYVIILHSASIMIEDECDSKYK
jgi:hypothetical protein